MNLQEIRQKYPQYNDLSDQELLDSFIINIIQTFQNLNFMKK